MAGCFLQHADRSDRTDLERGAVDIALQHGPVKHRSDQAQAAVDRHNAATDATTSSQDDVPVGVEVTSSHRGRNPGAKGMGSPARLWDQRPIEAVHSVLLLLDGRLPVDVHVAVEVQPPECFQGERLRGWHGLPEGASPNRRPYHIRLREGFSLARQVTTSVPVEAEPIVRAAMLEVEMPPVVAFGPQTARTSLPRDGTQVDSSQWKYVRPSPDELVLEGTDGGAPLDIRLKRRSRDGFPLVRRGFRWIRD